MKINDLAKELGQSKFELIRTIRTKGIRLKQNASKVDPQTASKIRAIFQRSREKESAEQKEVEVRECSIANQPLVMKDFAEQIDANVTELLTVVLQKGLTLNLNSEITPEVGKELANELNINLTIQEKDEEEADEKENLQMSIDEIEEKELNDHIDDLVERPPLITIMGHVDHGKTLLLDTIRKSNVVAKEAGGITQHIGAYQVTSNNKLLTFLDTPGHEAFTALRARGSQITDIAILVVAADEGIKPQTIEAINHAKAAKVPIIVAINKIDKPEANPDNVKQELSGHDLVAEDWGGSTIMVPISAKTGDGIDDLLEMLILQSELLELKAYPFGPVKGIVIESRLSKQKGPMATVLVKSGCLKVGDHILVDEISGKARALINDLGKTIKEAAPGCPVEVLGLAKVPQPGSIVEGFISEKDLKVVQQQRLNEDQVAKSKQLKGVSLDALSQQTESGDIKNINLILKADVNGSLEAILASIRQFEPENIAINILHAATGPINENDVMLAKASEAIILGFSIKANNEALKLATKEKITIRTHSIIYDVIDDFKKALDGMFEPEFEEVEIGRAEVRQIFKFSKVGAIAGSLITDGKINRNAIAVVLRNGEEIYKGKVESLKRFKDDVKEVVKGYECGIVLEKNPTIAEKDIIVTYKVQEKKII